MSEKPLGCLTILTEKNCVLLNSTYLAGSDLFHMFSKSIKFDTFNYRALKSTEV